MFSNTRSQSGQLLVEALLSVIILSISITVIIQSMSTSLRSTSYTSQYAKVINLMENQMFEVINKGFVESGIYRDRNFPSPDNRYRYQLRTRSLDGKGLEDINRVELTVFWQRGSKDNRISLDTYLFDKLE